MIDNRFKKGCCEFYNSNNIISCKESQNSLSFYCSGKQFYKIKIDGCEIIDNNVLKCDFMIIKNDEAIEIYIELKGSDIQHAIKQIMATIDSKGSKSAAKYGVVVATSIPPGTTLNKITKILGSKIGPNNIIVKNQSLKLGYSDGKIIKL